LESLRGVIKRRWFVMEKNPPLHPHPPPEIFSENFSPGGFFSERFYKRILGE